MVYKVSIYKRSKYQRKKSYSRFGLATNQIIYNIAIMDTCCQNRCRSMWAQMDGTVLMWAQGRTRAFFLGLMLGLLACWVCQQKGIQPHETSLTQQDTCRNFDKDWKPTTTTWYIGCFWGVFLCNDGLFSSCRPVGGWRQKEAFSWDGADEYSSATSLPSCTCPPGGGVGGPFTPFASVLVIFSFMSSTFSG